MKKMSKEELIEYFIEELGDNKILGSAISKEQIRKKFNNSILKLTFDAEPLGEGSWWMYGIKNSDTILGILNLDITKINKLNEDEQKMLINHELIHVIGTSVKKSNNTIYYKNGFHLFTFSFDPENNSLTLVSEFNKGINEGITHILAKLIAGNDKISGYEDEQDCCTLLTILLGQNELLNIYCDNDIEKYFNADSYDIFKDLIFSKYGEDLGKQMNIYVRKILKLSDELHVLSYAEKLDKNNIKEQHKLKETLRNYFFELFQIILDNEPNILKKIEILKKCIPTSINKEVTQKVLGELINDTTIDFNTKLNILHQIRAIKSSYIPQSIIENILFSETGLKQLSIEEQLEHYLYLMQGNLKWKNKAYELCVKSGKISEKLFSKKFLFMLSMPSTIQSTEEFYEILKQSKYCKIGNYYGLCGNTENNLWNPITQKIVVATPLDFNPFENNSIESLKDIKILSKILPESNIVLLCWHIKTHIKKAMQEHKKYSGKLVICGNLLTLKYIKNEQEQEEYFSINSNGTLNSVLIRRKT